MKQNNNGIFSRLFSDKTPEQVEEKPVVDESSIPTTGKSLPHTILTFTPEQEEKYSASQKEALQQELLELPPVAIGQINFVPVEVGALEGGYYVRMFIRNGKDLNEGVIINHLNLSLLDAADEVVAKGRFVMKNFGVLNFGESRYWTFHWNKDSVLKQEADLSSFGLSME